MVTISFKADEHLKEKLDVLAQKNGINTSAYIKLILTKGITGELSHLTENGLTVAEELAILESGQEDRVYGPFKTAKATSKALKKK